MNMNTSIIATLLIPFAGTLIGSAFVFFMKKEMPALLQKALLGFASGVMVAASVWSLLIPSMEMSAGEGICTVLPAAIGFIAGMGFLLSVDYLTPHLHIGDESPEGLKARISKTAMLALAVTIHNVPEGMAVGAAVAGSTGTGGDSVTLASTFALALGIAIQNFPEGAVVSMPLKSEGMKKGKAFVMGVLSGVVEPIGAAVMILLASFIAPLLPYMLSFAAGAMMYVVIEELIPEAQGKEHSNIGTIGAAAGFVVMMVLDCTLG
mgnify:CR=1 FL=1